jgi:NADH dehydrogenase FAD-containing subunit
MPTRSGLGCLIVSPFSLELIKGANPSGVETAAFKDQPEEEIDRLMHMIVVGGGPTGVEYAGELHDFLIVGHHPFQLS